MAAPIGTFKSATGASSRGLASVLTEALSANCTPVVVSTTPPDELSVGWSYPKDPVAVTAVVKVTVNVALAVARVVGTEWAVAVFPPIVKTVAASVPEAYTALSIVTVTVVEPL
jgi:hypothetical protein